jgi:ribosomal protein S18 acetylase RimI-like enzyme
MTRITKIRKYQESDWVKVWPIIKKVFRAGETYAYSPEITEENAHKVWIESPEETYVAVGEDGNIQGTYHIKQNQPGLGSHVCNCGYIVSENARGKGIASSMCEHSQQVAKALGFRAMQYNLVVSTNEGAICLWKKLGFQVIGKLPKAFKSKSAGYVDALVMYKELLTITT